MSHEKLTNARLELGSFWREAREAKGLSQREIAEILGYSAPQYVSNWERGKSLPPDEDILSLVKLLEVDPDEVIKATLRFHKKKLQVAEDELRALLSGQKKRG